MLQFAPKQAPKKEAAPKPPPGTPPPAAKKGVPKHVLVTVGRISRYCGVDIRITHGYIRRGGIKAYYKTLSDGTRDKRKYVYADEAYMAIKRTAVKSLKKDPAKNHAINAVRPGVLLSWNKGDGRREVGLVGRPSESGLVDVLKSTHKPMIALLPDLEKAVVSKQIVLEQPIGILKVVLEYLRLTNPKHPAIPHVEEAVKHAG